MISESSVYGCLDPYSEAEHHGSWWSSSLKTGSRERGSRKEMVHDVAPQGMLQLPVSSNWVLPPSELINPYIMNLSEGSLTVS